MKLEGFYKLNVKKEIVWKALNDSNILKQCIPGCETFTKEGKRLMLDDFKIDLAKCRDEWLTRSDKNSWNKVIKIAILKARFTNLILFNPDVQKAINSLFFSNCKIITNKLIKKTKGINLFKTLGIFKTEYEK